MAAGKKLLNSYVEDNRNLAGVTSRVTIADLTIDP
jgi:hypothetical protein